MVMAGSLAQWRDWTGLPFDRTSEVIVREVIVPVHCDTDHDHAVYVGPTVWRSEVSGPLRRVIERAHAGLRS